MTKEKFKVSQEEAFDLCDGNDDYKKISNESYCELRWFITHRYVVKRLKDGKFFELFIDHPKSDGQGWRDVNEDEIELEEVFPRVIETTIYE